MLIDYLKQCLEAEQKVYASIDANMSGVRTRAVALLTIASFVLSFSAGVGLIRSSKDGVSTIPATQGKILVVVVAAMAALVIWIVVPTGWSLGPRAVNFGYPSRAKVDPARSEEDATRNQEDAIRDALRVLIDAVNYNESSLRRRSWALTLCSLLFCAELSIIAWVVFS